MRLVDLRPRWINHGDRKGVGIRFDNPLGTGGWVRVLFENPLDGGPALPNDDEIPSNNSGNRWRRSGDTFETLSLSPSIDETNGGANPGWHGHITNGEAR